LKPKRLLVAVMSGFWADREVLVTGATGFIGGRLAEAIMDRGGHVRALTRDASRAEFLAEQGAEVVEGDITEPDGFAIGDPDVVIHAAAWVAFGIPSSKQEIYRATNVDGTKHVLAAAKEASVGRFCHMSSVAAIGPTPGGLYPEERATTKRYPEFQSLYSETKHAAHEHVVENHGSLRTVIPMPSVVLGLGGDFTGLMEAFLDGNVWNLKGDNPTGYVHVDDVVEGTLRAIEHGEGPYIFNDRNLTLRELWQLFADASGQDAPDREAPLWAAKALAYAVQTPYKLRGKVPPLSIELIEALEVPLTYSSRRAREELKWEPQLEAHLAEDFSQLQG
jgi:nucleoside-diphosphate-sugar epimerase